MATTSKPPIEDYAVHRDRLLEHAAQMIEAGDRIQASEKLWGVAAYGIKLISAARGWPHNTHSDTIVLARHIGALVGDRSINMLFKSLQTFHVNFYEDTEEVEGLQVGLEYARELAGLLRSAHETIPLDAPAPTDRQYVRRAAREAAREDLP